MAKPVVVMALGLVLLQAGCSGGGGGTTAAVPCNDAAFRAQDEELYVTKTAISNASGGGGAPAILLLDLKRARTALSEYLDAHPPCAEDLLGIAATERVGVDELDAAIAALEDHDRAGSHLTSALTSLQSAESALAGG